MTSRLRLDQARLTQRRIVEAMRGLLAEQGYTATTIAAVAEHAGVSVPTVYKAFGTKAAIVKRLYDVTLIGDDEPAPLGERPSAVALLDTPDAREKLGRYAALVADMSGRLAPLLSVLLGAAQSGDPELREFVQVIERERRSGVENLARNLDATGELAVPAPVAADILWLVTAPETHFRLVHESGWADDAFRRWLHDLLVAQLLAPVR